MTCAAVMVGGLILIVFNGPSTAVHAHMVARLGQQQLQLGTADRLQTGCRLRVRTSLPQQRSKKATHNYIQCTISKPTLCSGACVCVCVGRYGTPAAAVVVTLLARPSAGPPRQHAAAGNPKKDTCAAAAPASEH